jgi:serine/threonine-protein kinase
VEQHGSALAPGFRLDRYELLCPIAQGGMAEVWMARQTGKHGFEKMVAVKTILPKFADDEGFQRMFLDEAHVSSRIEHPNVAQILDVGEQDDITYLVMEYVDGDALSTLHKEAQRHGVSIPHGLLLRLMVEVCGGLHTAHELRMADGQHAGVVHRDVSPHNILVSTKGTAKLIDFGLAKALDRISDETSTGMVKGKLRYMAPEQVVGPSVDCRADVWAVGATLYHLLSGAPPYEAETDADVVRALMSRRPPRRLGHAVHPGVEAVVLRSLAWHADQRFATALELQRALELATRQAGLETSTSDVASFLAEHLGDRAQQRQEAIALGMREAAEREGGAEGARPSRPSAPFALLSARPGGADPRPRELWTPRPVPPPPSSGAPSAMSRRSIPAPEPANRGGSMALAIAVAILVLGGLGLAYRQRVLSAGLPVTAASPGPPASAASGTSVAAVRTTPAVAVSALAEQASAPSRPPGAAVPPAADSASSISMTVSVTDLPVAPTARPKVYVPVARPQSPHTAPAASAGQGSEDTATSESDGDGTQGQ